MVSDLPVTWSEEGTPYLESGRGVWSVSGSTYEGWRLDLHFSQMSSRPDITAKRQFGGFVEVGRDWRWASYLYDYLGDPDNAPRMEYERKAAEQK